MRLNQNQKWILVCGVIAVAIMCVYPPWTQTNPRLRVGDYELSAEEAPRGYAPIWDPPEAEPTPQKALRQGTVEISAQRLAVQCVVAVAVAVAGIILAGMQARSL